MRALMNRDELAQHEVAEHGRDYSKSGDGYDDMEVAATDGWHAVAGWGRDGWDLGNWPYVVLSVRNIADKFQMQQVCEGDHTVYEFASQDDRIAAIDYLFLWYQAGLEDLPITVDRESLNAGTFSVDERFRGPFSWQRLDATKAS